MVYNTKHMIQVIQINRTNNKGKKTGKGEGGWRRKRGKHNEWEQDKNHNFLD